ncbi:NACHT and WD40 domain protein [Penicillium canescens]|uniref:NACHT and WD40 domain protein n=1 Tax=Penicillium canescens TaxID=5083 RepID=UPI0026DF4196|nr:NACHT and WD40 domain protein [Penicillium canescens]KAJ6026350.1 NACHT and WD40 domain protein [Penicillium canescens]KAJ6041677.1 NACHT and WD40 domain protein [Penicillium canescens]
MEGISAAASVIGIIQLAGSIVKICGGYLQEVKHARDDIIALKRTVADLESTVEKIREYLEGRDGTTLTISSSLVRSIANCLSDLGSLKKSVDPGKGKDFMRRFGIRAFKWPLNRTEVDRLIQNLERCKSSFTLSLQVNQTTLLTGLARSADRVDQNSVLVKLPIAYGAEFDSYTNQHEDDCLPGTRTELLHQIIEWARSPQSKCIFWLNGMAGTGKSTISRTVAKSLKEAKLLGASFFFKRGEGDRGNAMKLFSTIVRQLVVRIPRLIPGVQKVLDDEPDIAGKSLKEQFYRLILQPILSLELSELWPLTDFRDSAIIVVIDALDECARDEDIRAILRLLPTLQESNTLRLRVFLTSRPELPIRLGISQIPSLDHQDMVLHEIPEPVVQHDISLFLKHRLSMIRMDRGLPNDWPEDTAIKSLVRMSAPLFIFAATACRILGDLQWDPEDSLAKLLAYQNDESQLDDTSRFDDMSQFDKTYLPVLNRLLEGQSKKQERELVREFHEVVGAIVTLESPLSVASLSRLLRTPEKQIDRRLSSLHSVLSIPSDLTKPVRLFHLSFRDFLLDSETRHKTPFWINEEQVHQRLTARCLEICGGLKQNMCGLGYGMKRTAIDSRIISRYFPPEMQYSCHFWAHHLSRCKEYLAGTENSLSHVHSFLQQHFLHWMEVLSILGLNSDIIGIINLLQSLLPVQRNVELSEFLHDARRFLLKNGPIADDAPLQLYCSGLIFAPKESILRRQFEREIPHWIHTFPEVDEAWSAELQTLEGHSGSVHSVAFASNGCLASGCGDEIIRLWDSSTGTLQQSLEGHSGRVHSVAFSSRGYLASGSSDGTVKIWDPDTGVLHLTFKGHSDWVNSVAFSPDGQLLASGSDDETVRLWDPSSGNLQQTLQGHSGRIQSVAFSSGGFLASGSDDETIGLWDPNTGLLRRTFVGHSDWVKSVAFSPDGRLLASASYDKTIRTWDPSTGVLLQTLEGHSDRVNSVAFSPDGRVLASASKDKTVRLWDSTTGILHRTFDGHSGSALSVVFSSCGQLLASGSYDMTARLWDPAMGTQQHQTLEGHSDWIYSVSFSPDGGTLASGSRDTTIRLWDPVRGVVQQTLRGHSLSVRAVVFSPDGQFLASGSYDKTVRVWNPSTGVLQQVLEGHSSRVRSVAFSPDSRLLASISNDEALILWNPTNGTALQQISGVNRLNTTLKLSQDGSYLGNNLGSVDIQSWFKNHGSNPTWEIVNIWIENDQWIALRGNNVLWLPPEYRPKCSAVNGNTLVLGHSSGRISFIGFHVKHHGRR